MTNNLNFDATVYVDGSYDPDSKTYGYGVVFVKSNGDVEEFWNANNAPDVAALHNVGAELLGAMFATKYAMNQGLKRIKICYDYEGVERWATRVWKAKKPKTMEYVRYMSKCMKDIDIEFEKVKAHSGIEYNERADLLAKNAVYNYICG